MKMNTDIILALLKEYTDKLQRADDFGPDRFDDFRKGISIPARKLAQFVSQQLGSVSDDSLRLELELRLAEFEAALAQSSRIRKVVPR